MQAELGLHDAGRGIGCIVATGGNASEQLLRIRLQPESAKWHA
jgi:hypothetical protein